MELEATVYIVDDDQAVLTGISDVVRSIGLKAKAWTTAEAFMAEYQPEGPGCLVLDVRMPGMSGLDLQKELARVNVTLPIIVVSGHGNIRMAVEAMNEGAMEFLEKPFRRQELRDCILRAIRLDESVWRRRRDCEDAARRIADLAPQERQVLQCVLAGKADTAIAMELGLGVAAVEQSRALILSRLGAASLAEVIELETAARGL